MRSGKTLKAIAAGAIAAAMLTTSVANAVPMTVSADELFVTAASVQNGLPWETKEEAPAKQTFSVEESIP